MHSSRQTPPLDTSRGSGAALPPPSRNGNGYGSGYGYGSGDGYGYHYGYGGYGSTRSAEFARTWHGIVEKAWVIILITAVFLGLAYAYIKRTPAVYSATATVEAEQDQPDILKMQLIQLKDVQSLDYLQTVAQTLCSRPLLERVAETNHLWTDPRLASGTNGLVSHRQVLDRLAEMVDVNLRGGTRLIDIQVKNHIPELTAEIANSIVNEYINARAEREDAAIGTANKSLAKEAERLRLKLEQSEQALQNYKARHNATSLDDRQNTVVAKLQELSAKATEAKSVRISKETEYNQLLQLGTNIDALLTFPAIASDPSVASIQLSLTHAENDFAVLRQRYKQKHPKYIQAATQIAELRDDLSNAVLNVVKTLKAGVENARASEEALNEAMKAQQAATLNLGDLSIQYSVLAREVESDRALYTAVLKGMKEASVTQATQQTGIVRMVQPAYVPEHPVWPKRIVILGLAGFAGIFLGGFLVLGLRLVDNSIKTVDEAENVLGMPVFSVVPNTRGVRRNQTPLMTVERPRSGAAEAFRTLRTSLSTLGSAEDRRVFLFTSALPAEGKTFCTLNYATSLAQLGLKVLLIDADLRRPCVEAGLTGEQTEAPGLSDHLSGSHTLEQVVRSTEVENLFFISGGSTANSPAELLAKEGLTSLLEEALNYYDRVVVDSAPINAVSDTLLMLKSVQTVCLVVRAAHTSSRYVMRCVQLLQSAEAPLAGVILNRMPRRRGHSYGAYYDYDYHGKYSKKGVYGRA